MSNNLLETFQDTDKWKSGVKLISGPVVNKDEAHDKNLLHLSAHLLIIDSANRILARKRKDDDFRYAGLWTSTIGTHVLVNNDYLSTLKGLLPLQRDLEYLGEFRVHDEWENEINGLYILRADEKEVSAKFLEDKKFFTADEVTKLVQKGKTTPHLKGALELIKK